MFYKFSENGRSFAKARLSKKSFRENINKIYQTIINDKSEIKDILLNKFIDPLNDHQLSKLKIGYFLWHFPVPSETFVINEINLLISLGYEVKVFCKASPHVEFSQLTNDISFQIVSSPSELAKKFFEEKINIAHSIFTYPTVTEMLYPACELAGIPFTFTAHSGDIFKYSEYSKQQS